MNGPKSRVGGNRKKKAIKADLESEDIKATGLGLNYKESGVFVSLVRKRRGRLGFKKISDVESKIVKINFVKSLQLIPDVTCLYHDNCEAMISMMKNCYVGGEIVAVHTPRDHVQLWKNGFFDGRFDQPGGLKRKKSDTKISAVTWLINERQTVAKKMKNLLITNGWDVMWEQGGHVNILDLTKKSQGADADNNLLNEQLDNNERKKEDILLDVQKIMESIEQNEKMCNSGKYDDNGFGSRYRYNYRHRLEQQRAANNARKRAAGSMNVRKKK